MVGWSPLHTVLQGSFLGKSSENKFKATKLYEILYPYSSTLFSALSKSYIPGYSNRFKQPHMEKCSMFPYFIDNKYNQGLVICGIFFQMILQIKIREPTVLSVILCVSPLSTDWCFNNCICSIYYVPMTAYMLSCEYGIVNECVNLKNETKLWRSIQIPNGKLVFGNLLWVDFCYVFT